MANEEVLGPRKTMFVLVIVVGCFAVLWPRILSPLILGHTRNQLKPNQFDREAGCCEVMFETEVAILELINEVCSSAVHVNGKLSPFAAAECRKAVNETCGVDIAAFLKRDENVGKTTKKLLDTMKNSNSSCLKEHFGVSKWSVSSHQAMNSWNLRDTMKQERPLMKGGQHPALRERGRAIPTSPSSGRTVTMPPHMRVRSSPLEVYFELDIKPPPIPGMRPPLGSPGGPVPTPKSSMGFVMPIYTICIIIFFVYTLSKIIFKRTGTTPYESISPDPHFRRRVFRDDSRTSPDKLGHKETDTIVTAISGLVAEVQQQMEASYAQNQQRQDLQDNHARPYTNGTVLHNSGPVHIVASEYREKSKEKSPEPDKGALSAKVNQSPLETILEPEHTSPESTETAEPTTEQNEFSNEPNVLPSEPIQPYSQYNEFTPECTEILPEPKELTPEPKESTPESKELSPEPKESTPEPKELTPEPKECTPEPKELTPEPEVCTPEPKEPTPEPKESAPEPKEISKELTPKPADVSSELIVLLSQSKEITTDPTELTLDSKEFTSELIDFTQEPTEYVPDANDITPEPKELTSATKEYSPDPHAITPEHIESKPELIEQIPQSNETTEIYNDSQFLMQKETSPEPENDVEATLDLNHTEKNIDLLKLTEDIEPAQDDLIIKSTEELILDAKNSERDVESSQPKQSTPELLEEALKEESPEKESDDGEEEDKGSVKVIGMELTAHTADGAYSAPPPLPAPAPTPQRPHEAGEVKSIYLEGEIPQQSRVLVAEFEDRADRPAPTKHSPMVVSGKMTLSLIQDAPRDTPERELESTLDDFTTASGVTQPAAEEEEYSEEEIEEEIEVEEIEEEVEVSEEETEEPIPSGQGKASGEK